MIDFISQKIGFPDDQVRFLVSIILCYPLGIINHYIRVPTLRLIYGTVAGILVSFFMYGAEIYHLAILTLITYLFMKFFGRKYSAFIILGISMAHLSGYHIYRIWSDYGGWKIDVTTILMMSICKFSSIAFSYEDGALKDEEIKSDYLRTRKLVELPTFFEMVGFIFFYPSCVVGPSFEFIDFKKFVELDDEYKDIPISLAIKSGLSQFLYGILCVVIMSIGFSYVALEDLVSEEFSNKPFYVKFFLFNFVMACLRAKYYSGWKFGQSCVDMCGLSYSKPKKTENNSEIKHSFNKIQCVVISKVELDLDPKVKIQWWNRTVHLWLKYSVFIRLRAIKHPLFSKGTGMASLITFFVSAFWHGFYPAYYICFAQLYLVEQFSEILGKTSFFAKLDKLPIIFKPILLFFSMSFPSYLGIVFSHLMVSRTYIFMKELYFIPTIYTILIWAYCVFVLDKKIRKRERDAKEKVIKAEKELKKD